MLQTSIAEWLKQGRPAANSAHLDEDASTRPGGSTNQFSKSSNGASPIHSRSSHIVRSTEPGRSLPVHVSISPCTEQHLQAFRRLNALLLPIPYPDKFYVETINDPIIASVTKIAVWHDSTPDSQEVQSSALATRSPPKLVASVRCRILQSPPNKPNSRSPSLYISTLTTLAPFRGLGLGTHLLSQVTSTAVKEHGVTSITAHVWEANEEALEWYKRRGFRIVGKEDSYYRRLAPKTAAWIVLKDIAITDSLIADSRGTLG